MGQGPAHIPSLNGVRALAVLVVFVGHGATVGSWWPGHVGVTVFFFLSGFLIVTLLRREHERHGKLFLGRFYVRRLLRIQPPAFVAIAVAVVLGAVGLLEPPAQPAGVAAGLLSYVNYYIVFNGRQGLPPDSTQLWSLGVEEHYYLLIPAALIFLLGHGGRRTAGIALLGVATAVPVWRGVLGLTGASFDRLYVSTDTRIDSLLVGSAMALLMNPALGDPLLGGDRVRAAMRWVPAAAALGFLVSALVPSQAFRLVLADCVQYACLVPIFWFIITKSEGRVGRLLNHRMVAYLGVLSYSIYLLHRIALGLVADRVGPAPVSDALALLAVVLAAVLMRVLIEKPLEGARRRLSTSPAGRHVAIRR